jgi:hypothetical protein
MEGFATFLSTSLNLGRFGGRHLADEEEKGASPMGGVTHGPERR